MCLAQVEPARIHAADSATLRLRGEKLPPRGRVFVRTQEGQTWISLPTQALNAEEMEATVEAQTLAPGTYDLAVCLFTPDQGRYCGMPHAFEVEP